MAANTLIGSLKQVQLFQGLTPLQITEIARHSERIVFKPGDTIIAEGQAGDAAFIIVGGEAVRTDGPGLAAPELVQPGALIGEMAMLVETEHTSTVIARGPVKALRIPRETMLHHMAADPTIADHLVRKISGRLHGILQELREIEQRLDPASGGEGPAPVMVVAGATGQLAVLDTVH